jgi:hypothetical protein
MTSPTCKVIRPGLRVGGSSLIQQRMIKLASFCSRIWTESFRAGGPTRRANRLH